MLICRLQQARKVPPPQTSRASGIVRHETAFGMKRYRGRVPRGVLEQRLQRFQVIDISQRNVLFDHVTSGIYLA
jgi:hypothetical protein